MNDEMLRAIVFLLLPTTAVLGLHFGVGLSWWVSVPIGIVGYVAAAVAVLVIVSKLEDRELRRRGLPLLDDSWPSDTGNSN